ncbi:hypothetical protein [Sulfitobacter sp. 15WGC]|uniref:hypothetical protein n=1 Tax=Sulfitobacter sp. 15WGC TaxID=2575437 RepID=UPI00200AC9DE|nr:hypothetical protein [Sulfitobacter sp. 15WGC]
MPPVTALARNAVLRIIDGFARVATSPAPPRIWTVSCTPNAPCRAFFRQRRHGDVKAQDLPDGSFVLDHDGQSGVLLGDALHPYAPEGYGAAQRRPQGRVTLLTPPSIVAAFRNGYRPQIALAEARG